MAVTVSYDILNILCFYNESFVFNLATEIFFLPLLVTCRRLALLKSGSAFCVFQQFFPGTVAPCFSGGLVDFYSDRRLWF